MLPAAERYDVPGPTSECASCEEVSVGESAHQRVPQIEGRVVRLADFLTEDPPEPSELLHWPGSFRHQMLGDHQGGNLSTLDVPKMPCPMQGGTEPMQCADALQIAPQLQLQSSNMFSQPQPQTDQTWTQMPLPDATPLMQMQMQMQQQQQQYQQQLQQHLPQQPQLDMGPYMQMHLQQWMQTQLQQVQLPPLPSTPSYYGHADSDQQPAPPPMVSW